MRPRKKLRRKVSARIAKLRALGRRAVFFCEYLPGHPNRQGFYVQFLDRLPK